MKSKIVEVAVKVLVAALTAFLTAITTTSCMGWGPIHVLTHDEQCPTQTHTHIHMLDPGETCSNTAHTHIGYD